MKSTRKNNNHFFGCKAHTGVDKDSGLVHTIVLTAANIHDSTVALELLHGEESEVYGDSGYLGIDKKENSPTNITYNINKRLSSIRKIESEQERKLELEKHRNKCSVRARVEHPYSIIKCIFGFRKTRYKGKEKNESLLNILFACANLVRLAMQGKQLNKGAFRP